MKSFFLNLSSFIYKMRCKVKEMHLKMKQKKAGRKFFRPAAKVLCGFTLVRFVYLN